MLTFHLQPKMISHYHRLDYKEVYSLANDLHMGQVICHIHVISHCPARDGVPMGDTFFLLHGERVVILIRKRIHLFVLHEYDILPDPYEEGQFKAPLQVSLTVHQTRKATMSLTSRLLPRAVLDVRNGEYTQALRHIEKAKSWLFV
jgi:hypothetical protein